jgi:hypothetical protein
MTEIENADATLRGYVSRQSTSSSICRPSRSPFARQRR